jgi:hypothetical protein
MFVAYRLAFIRAARVAHSLAKLVAFLRRHHAVAVDRLALRRRLFRGFLSWLRDRGRRT